MVTTTFPAALPDQTPGQTIVVYDAVGNRKKVIDANEHATTYSYDSLSRLLATTDAEGQTPSATYETTVVYDALGRQTEVIDPRGNLSSYHLS